MHNIFSFVLKIIITDLYDGFDIDLLNEITNNDENMKKNLI